MELLGQGTADAAAVDRYTRDRGVMARSLTYLYAAGAAISLITLAIPHEGTETDIRRVVVQAGCGLLLAALVALGGRRLPRWSFQIFLAAATLLIEWNIYASGDSTSPYAALYFWISIYAFYFFTRSEAIIQTGFIVVAYAALLTQVPNAGDASVLRWTITMSALVVGGALIGVLQERIVTLARAARTDADTGLLNRQGLREALDAELDRARRGDTALSVVIARIEGHRPLSSGGSNRVLELVAETAQRAKRGMDHAALLGQTEVALVVPECDAHGAYMVAERLRAAARAELGDQPTSISLSLGVASYPQHGATAEAVLHAAAQGVAAAEHLGNDRTVIYNPEIASLVLAAEKRSSDDRGSNLAAVLALTEVLDIRDTGTSVHS